MDEAHAVNHPQKIANEKTQLMPIQMKEADGKMPVAQMRERFEKAVNGTPMLKSKTPLGVMEINGAFSHYMNAETDTLWIGFAIGLRFAEREGNHVLQLALKRIDELESEIVEHGAD